MSRNPLDHKRVLQLRERIGEEETAGLQRAKARLAARAAQEEELMARVPLSKTERKNLKARRRAGLSGGVMLDDFADDVADLIQVGFLRIHQCLQQGILWLIWLWHGSYRSVLSYLNAKYCRSILVVGVTGASQAFHICNFGAGQRRVLTASRIDNYMARKIE